jgi:hypothetical protein
MKSYVSRTLTERVIFKVADLITCVPAYQYDVLVVSRRYQFSFSYANLAQSSGSLQIRIHKISQKGNWKYCTRVYFLGGGGSHKGKGCVKSCSFWVGGGDIFLYLNITAEKSRIGLAEERCSFRLSFTSVADPDPFRSV